MSQFKSTVSTQTQYCSKHIMFKIHSDLYNQLQSETSISSATWKRGVTPLLGPKILFLGSKAYYSQRNSCASLIVTMNLSSPGF